MRHDWVVAGTLYGLVFLLSLALRWPFLSQSYTDFEWITAHSQLIVDNWLSSGFWHERGLSFLNPASIEFPTLLAREPYISYPCGAQLPLFIVAKVFGVPVTPWFFYAWGLLWYGLLGGLLMTGVWLSSATIPTPERRSGAVLTGVLWLGSRGPLAFFPTLWYADIAVLLPLLLTALAEVITAHHLVGEQPRRWIAWSMPVLIFWGTYTDWLFVPLCLALLGYRCWHTRHLWHVVRTAWWQIGLPAGLALTCFGLQLFWLLGSEFLAVLLERFLARSLDTSRAFATPQDMVWRFAEHGLTSVGWCSLLLLLLSLSLLVRRPQRLSRPCRDFLLLLTVPALILLALFRQHAAIHAFTVVKFMLPIAVLSGSLLPWLCPGRYQTRLLTVLVTAFLLYEGWQYRLTFAEPTPRSTLEWGAAIRRHFEFQDILLTREPSLVTPAVPPMALALSRKRIYLFDPERVAALRRDLPTARLFVLDTAPALQAFCPTPTHIYTTLYACRLYDASSRAT